MRSIKYVLLISIFYLCSCGGCEGDSLSVTEIIDYNLNYVGIVNNGNYTGNIEVQYFNIDSNKIISSFYNPPCLVGGYKTKLKNIIQFPFPKGGVPWFSYRSQYDWTNSNYFKIINHTNVGLDYFIFGGENQLKSVSLNEFQSNYILIKTDFGKYNDTIKTRLYQGEIAISTPIISYNLTPIYYLYFNDRIQKKNLALFTYPRKNNIELYDKKNINFNYLFKDTSAKYCGGQVIEQKYSLSDILNIYKTKTNNLNINISYLSNLDIPSSLKRDINNYFGIIQPKDSITNSLNIPLIDYFHFETNNKLN